jgi:hypothetical protein
VHNLSTVIIIAMLAIILVQLQPQDWPHPHKAITLLVAN